MAEAAARLREAEGKEAPAGIFSKEELDAAITADKKAFLKTKCAECGGSCGLMKRYKDTMSMIIMQTADSFWCKDCGRVLCGTHRYQHTCERVDAEKEKRKHMTAEQIRDRMEADAARQAAAELAKREFERAAAVLEERKRVERKEKRKLIASKARHVEQFVQRCAREDGRPQRVLAELLEMYPRVSRISLSLYNEFENPSSQEVGGQDWEDLKAHYARARELTGMYIMTEEGPLSMRNPWDPPEEEQQPEMQEGPGE